jgi:UTP:GlnB (protein PII) uridylyltransferase
MGLCGLCAWQWYRESLLRELYGKSTSALAILQHDRDELMIRVKAADGEILRVNQSLIELRANSVSKAQHAELTERHSVLKDGIEKQNAMIIEQTAALAKAATSMEQANRNIRALTSERDDVVAKLNATITEMNARQAKATPEKP